MERLYAAEEARTRRDLSEEEQQRLRTDLIGENAENIIGFMERASLLFGPAEGILLKELVFWYGKGIDPGGESGKRKANSLSGS